MASFNCLICFAFPFFILFSVLDTTHISTAEVREMYETWLLKHGKIYNTMEEEESRFSIFHENLKFINEHNADQNRPYKVGLNRFADLTNEEFRSKFVRGGIQRQMGVLSEKSDRYAYQPDDDEELPEKIDWRKRGAVTSVKSQQCGDCWAFCAIGAVEGINQIVTGDLISLSEQELVDCDPLGNGGCDGGYIEWAFQYIINNSGIASEKDYPYSGIIGKCHRPPKNSYVVTLDSWEQVPQNERSLKKAVAHQPISVAVDSNTTSFQFYESGIYTAHCGTHLDHGVVAVGYDTENGLDYWILKNSWSPDWGEHGFMRLQRNLAHTNTGKCGVTLMSSYPVKNVPNPPNSDPSPAPSPHIPGLSPAPSPHIPGLSPAPSPHIPGLSPAPSPHIPGLSPAPSPTNQPETICDDYSTCPGGFTCCSSGCCPVEAATCCDDNISCCPVDYPICDTSTGTCLMSEYTVMGVQAFQQVPARLIRGWQEDGY